MDDELNKAMHDLDRIYNCMSKVSSVSILQHIIDQDNKYPEITTAIFRYQIQNQIQNQKVEMTKMSETKMGANRPQSLLTMISQAFRWAT